MRNPSRPLWSVLARAGALFGVAPSAAVRRLVAVAGEPVPYRVALPEGAEIEHVHGLLSARSGDVAVVVAATDMLRGASHPPPASAAESRRTLTNLVMGSDSLLFALLDEEFRNRKLHLEDVVRGMGTLGGQRSACVRGRFRERETEGWLAIHATVHDGILYMLVFTVLGGGPGRHDALFARIRESFVLPG